MKNSRLLSSLPSDWVAIGKLLSGLLFQILILGLRYKPQTASEERGSAIETGIEDAVFDRPHFS